MSKHIFFLFDHLAVCITVLISAVLCPMTFNNLIIYFSRFLIFKGVVLFLLASGLLWSVSFQINLVFSLFLFSHTMGFILIFPKMGEQTRFFGFFMRENKKGDQFSNRQRGPTFMIQIMVQR